MEKPLSPVDHAPGTSRRVYVVAGMHRAGTSVVARALQALGVDLGAHLMSADVRMNARGFFEDLDLVRIDDALGRYVEFAKQSFPRGRTLEKLRVVVDCANGAAYKSTPCILRELGAEVIDAEGDMAGAQGGDAAHGFGLIVDFGRLRDLEQEAMGQ